MKQHVRTEYENKIVIENGRAVLISPTVKVRKQGGLYFAQMKKGKPKRKPIHDINRNTFVEQWVKYIKSSDNAKRLRKKTLRDYLNYFVPKAMLTITDKNHGRDINNFVASVKKYLSKNYKYVGVIEKQSYYHFHILIDRLPTDLIEVNRQFRDNKGGHYTKKVLTSKFCEKNFGLSEVSKIYTPDFSYLEKYITKGKALPFYSRKIKRYILLDIKDLKNEKAIFYDTVNFTGMIFDKNIKKIVDK